MDELIKRLRDIARNDGNIKSNYIGLSLLQAADAIEELTDRNVGKWIPVTERLPEGKTNVLCCGANGGMFVGWTGGYVFEGKARAFVHGGSGRNITHWMPLPEPPKEET